MMAPRARKTRPVRANPAEAEPKRPANPQGQRRGDQDQPQGRDGSADDQDEEVSDEEREVVLELEAQEIQLLVDEVTELSEQVLDQPARASPSLARPGRTTQHQRRPRYRRRDRESPTRNPMPAATTRAINGERAMKSRVLMMRMFPTIEFTLVIAWLRPSAASDRPLRIGTTTFCSLPT